MPETSKVKRIHKRKPFTGRPAGRPKSRWEDDVRNDLKKMRLMKWAEQVQNHLKWKDIVENQSCSAVEEEEKEEEERLSVIFHQSIKREVKLSNENGIKTVGNNYGKILVKF